MLNTKLIGYTQHCFTPLFEEVITRPRISTHPHITKNTDRNTLNILRANSMEQRGMIHLITVKRKSQKNRLIVPSTFITASNVYYVLVTCLTTLITVYHDMLLNSMFHYYYYYYYYYHNHHHHLLYAGYLHLYS